MGLRLRTAAIVSILFTHPVWAQESKNVGNVTQIQDSQIASSISSKLFFDRSFDPQQVGVQTHDGRVTLSGVVDNMRSKDRAIRIAESTRGVQAVVDQLTVKQSEKSDSQIQEEVSTAIQSDPTTASLRVRPQVKSGVVDLNGTVSSWGQKKWVGSLVKSVEGVRAVNNYIQIQPGEARSDPQIQKEILGRLERDPLLYQDGVRVNVERGHVYLNGNVGSPYSKRRAQDLAWVTGVSTVDGKNLQVMSSWTRPDQNVSGSKMKRDQRIQSSIQESFSYDPRIEALRPRVSVANGKVTLAGTVNSLVAKQAAEENSWNTIGVVDVKNQLTVRPRFKRTDQEIFEDLAQSLRRSLPEWILDEVEFSVSQGVVTLRGRVGSPYSKWEVRDAASHVKGIRDLRNLVQVESKTAKVSNKRLRNRIEAELFWSPVVDWANDHFDITVNQGVAKISGTVDDWVEHLAATREAFEAGATRVENSMRVRTTPNQPPHTYIYTFAFPTVFSLNDLPVT